MVIDAQRAQLIHIETDRRLGHEWDEWDGGPLPNGGDFSAPPGLFFRYAALTLVVLCAAAAGVLFLLSPPLAAVAPAVPREAGAGGRAGDRRALRGAGVRGDARPAGAARDPRAAAAGRRRRRLRARHDDGPARRRGQAPGARPHDAARQRPLPRRDDRSGRDGELGARARRRLSVRPTRYRAIAPSLSFNFPSSRSAILYPSCSLGTTTSRSRSVREGS